MHMNILTTEKRVAVISALVEGCSVRSTVRLTKVAKDTVLSLLKQVGEVCLDYQDQVLRNLPCKRLELDEIWCFCYSKDKNVPAHMQGMPGIGSMWTWTAIDAETKLVPSWRLGARDAANAHAFISDLSGRLANRIQLTTDGNRVYVDAVETYMGGNVDFAQLIKQYGQNESPDRAYSPAKCLGTKKKQVDGNPDMEFVSTSYAERQNLNIRMKNRRFTRLTNAFSKKAENLAYSIALDFMHHNFVRKHMTIKTTPARAAGIANRTWTIQDIVELLPAACHSTRF
jgi:IS1 family transposase